MKNDIEFQLDKINGALSLYRDYGQRLEVNEGSELAFLNELKLATIHLTCGLKIIEDLHDLGGSKRK